MKVQNRGGGFSSVVLQLVPKFLRKRLGIASLSDNSDAALARIEASDEALSTHRTISDISLSLIAFCALITMLRWGQGFFVPLLVGIFMSYALRPWVNTLARIYIPRAFGAALVICVVTTLLGAGIFSARDAVLELTEQLPDAAHKLHRVLGGQRTATNPLAQIKRAASELDKAAAEATGTPAPRAAAIASNEDSMVSVAGKMLVAAAASTLSVAAELGVGALVAYFLLSSGDAFRRKVLHIVGPTLARRRITIELLNDIDIQIQRSLAVMMVTNVIIALSTWALFAAFDVPYAGSWGILAGVLHFLPYIGTLLIVLVAALIGLTEFSGVTQAAILAGSTMLVTALPGFTISLWLQSNASRMNAVVALVGLLFFGWLWGAWGMLLGLPALAVIKSIADRVTALHPLAEIMAG